eukprot:365245-Chlamydomonas_euryale.AAC.3
MELDCGVLNAPNFTPYILGDAGYASLSWLMTPIPTAQANTTDLVRWNTVHSSARMVIERTFGRLKALLCS